MKRERSIPLPTVAHVASAIERKNDGFVWRAPRIRAGQAVALKRHRNGYTSLRIDGATLMIHRVIWALHYGQWPVGEIDHLNGDPADNRIVNLRDVSKSLNMRNQRLRSDNTTGCAGVHFHTDKKRRPWAARLGINGKWKLLGYFATKDEAIACRLREQVRNGFTARHGHAQPIADAVA